MMRIRYQHMFKGPNHILGGLRSNHIRSCYISSRSWLSEELLASLSEYTALGGSSRIT